MSNSNIRTRIAPSPTGIAHVGTLYMALFNYAFAKQNNGQFIVRSEDTDRNRYVEGAEEVVLEALQWAGLPPDEDVNQGGPYGPYRQSERLEIYQQYAQQLLDQGDAYYCFATSEELAKLRKQQQQAGQAPHYDGRYRDYPLEEAKKRIAAGEPYVIRLKVPEGESKWHDLIRGEVVIAHQEVSDQVLVKADGYPTYHLAVVVDDHLMKISHVIRGEEWISSTPKHLLLYQMLGWEAPQFAHMPLLRNPDKSKLSKRRNDVAVTDYQQKGYLPAALINFLMLLGWSHPDKKEIISLTEFIETFSIERMQTTGPVFDINKLNWMNGKYIREVLSREELKASLRPYLQADIEDQLLDEIIPLVRERLVTLTDFNELTDFFYNPITIEPTKLLKKANPELVKSQLAITASQLENLKTWGQQQIEQIIRNLQLENEWKKGQYFMMLRLAVTGRKVSPPLFETIKALGQNQVVERLQAAQAVV